MPSLIGTKVNQVPTVGDLGTLAFQDSNAVNLTGGTAVIDNLTADAINLKVDTDISNIAPSLNLDFANSKTLDPRITYTRASTATYYDGVTTAKAEENLLTYSAEFNDATWSKTNSTVTANSTVAPDGTTTGDTLTASAGTFSVQISKNITVASANTTSVFIKAGTHPYVQIRYFGDSTSFVNFDVTSGSGAVGTSGGTATGSIVDAGNGWYRCIAVNTSTAVTIIYVNLVPSSSSARAASLTAAGTETVYLWGAQLEQRSAVSSYTPTTTQAITNYIPALQTAASGVARFEHNPTTGESLGLLIEEARTNLVTYSDDFSNAVWAKTRSSITSNTVVAPDGTLTGDKLVENTAATATHPLTIPFTPASATTFTYSVYLKAAGRSWVAIQFDSLVSYFNLESGVLGTVAAGITASITSVGNGWYRCSVVRTFASTAATTIFHYPATANGTTSYTGDGFSGIYIWGAQLEAGAFATSYIPTVASQVTRAADAASMTGTNFSSWYNQQEGTIYTEQIPRNIAGSNQAAATLYEAALNYISIGQGVGFSAASNNFYVKKTSDEAFLGGIANSVQANVLVKSSGAYKVNDFGFSYNGITALTDTVGTLPTPVQLLIGKSGVATYCNGTIKKLQYFPKRLTNAELVEMTS